MATTGKVKSNLLAVFVERIYDEDGTVTAVGGLGGTEDTYNAVGASNNATLSLTRDTIDATKKENDGARVILPAGEQFQMTCEGFVMYDETTTFTGLDLFDIWKNKYKVKLAWMTGVDDDYMFTGEAYLVNYEQSAGTNDAATYSCTFEGTGSIVKNQIDTSADTIQHV
jgi:predicted secreted protein|tara:strand:- start:869 stop:1375 length:507 start_codon:yes stop_codon:yes gene_type:complete